MKITEQQISSLEQHKDEYDDIKVVLIYFPVRGFEVISYEHCDVRGLVVTVFNEDLDVYGDILIENSVGYSLIATEWHKADLTVAFGKPTMYELKI